MQEVRLVLSIVWLKTKMSIAWKTIVWLKTKMSITWKTRHVDIILYYETETQKPANTT